MAGPKALLDYDAEADAYDASRGGVPRAEPAYRLRGFVRG